MRRLLLLACGALALSGCSLLQGVGQLSNYGGSSSYTSAPSAPASTDPAPAMVARVDGPNYSTLTLDAGRTPALEAVAHLTGPALRVKDRRCRAEETGLLCELGTLLPGSPATIYVSGLSDARLNYRRKAGGPVYTSP